MAQNEQEMPWASQQQLAHNSCWEKQSFHRLLFLCLFGLFTPSYECICDRFHQRQCCDSRAEIFIFDHFLLETVWNGKESGVTCGSRTRLTCSILCKIYTGFKLVSLKSLNSQQFPQQSVSSDEMPHLMQFSEAAHKLCMVHCVLFDCNGTKWTGNAQQQLAHNSCWGKQTSHRLLFLCLFGLFTTWYEVVCDRLD